MSFYYVTPISSPPDYSFLLRINNYTGITSNHDIFDIGLQHVMQNL